MYVAIDSSALLAVVGNEPAKAAIVRATEGRALCAPASVHWEMGHTISGLVRRGRIDLARARQALAAYRAIPLRLVDVSLGRSLELESICGIGAYEAYVVQCAIQMDAPLLTLDPGLRTAAARLGVAALEMEP